VSRVRQLQRADTAGRPAARRSPLRAVGLRELHVTPVWQRAMCLFGACGHSWSIALPNLEEETGVSFRCRQCDGTGTLVFRGERRETREAFCSCFSLAQRAPGSVCLSCAMPIQDPLARMFQGTTRTAVVKTETSVKCRACTNGVCGDALGKRNRKSAKYSQA
jgi:hypothetical protein